MDIGIRTLEMRMPDSYEPEKNSTWKKKKPCMVSPLPAVDLDGNFKRLRATIDEHFEHCVVLLKQEMNVSLSLGTMMLIYGLNKFVEI